MKRILLLVALCWGFLHPALSETFVVAVGIAKYQNISNLHLCENDAHCMAQLYRQQTNHVITITGSNATKANIVKVLNEQFCKAKKGDMVVFFFSGHGYEGGFCPYNMGTRKQNALSYNDLYAIFRNSNATKKIVLADACMSGGMRRERRGASHQSTNANVLMFLSSRTSEYSIENGKMKNGFFTTYLERGLRGGADTNRDRIVTAKEIFNFVSSGVKQISRNKQHPVMWGHFDDNLVMLDWRK